MSMSMNVAAFVKTVADSGILSFDSLDAYLRNPEIAHDSSAFAERLVQDGLLTGYQAKRIAGGESDALLIGPYVVLDVLGTGAEGFFAEGRLRFGQDLRSSDIVQALMQVEGVASVVLQRFARVGGADQTQAGVIRLDGIELASCDPFPVQPGQPARGSLRLTCTGGLKG